MSDPATIRAHLQMAYVLSAGMCKEAEKSFKGPKNECAGCDVAKHLEAAIELLDKARVIEGRYYGNSPYIWFKDGERIRLITDPEGAS